MSTPPASSILLPLYIYPDPHAWNPLYTSITSHPNLHFTIIINPSSGPGAIAFPNPDYTREITRLNTYSNVTLVGYVPVSYCKRHLGDVCEDVRKYAGWSKYGRGELGLKGIFVDETPNEYTVEGKEYLDAVDECVKGSTGVGEPRLIIHNPGTVPFAQLANPGPDITTIFETTYWHFLDSEVQQRITNLLRYERGRCCYMVLGVPKEEIRGLVRELRRRAGYIFITERTEKFYEGFGQGWVGFVESMAEGL